MPLHIETLNSLLLPAFCAKFWPHDTIEASPSNESTSFHVSLETPSTMSPLQMQQCFELITSTSSTNYAGSSIGWSPAKKRKEMRLPDLRYAILSHDPSGSVQGFMSFMLTYEDGVEVIYCYEIHLAQNFQGKGLGRRLIKMMEEVGREAGVDKAMLTVFVANNAALGFYERLGYEEDEYSPQSRKLRNGVVKKSDYVILSRPLKTGREECQKESGKSGRHGEEQN